MKKTLIYLVISILLIILGFVGGKTFWEVSISELDLNNVSISWMTMGGQFNQDLILALAIGLLPLLFLTSTKFSKTNSFGQKIIILGTILFTGLLLWKLRILQLNIMFENFPQFGTNADIKNSYTAEELKFGLYLIYGLIIGTLISALTLRQVNRNKIEK